MNLVLSCALFAAVAVLAAPEHLDAQSCALPGEIVVTDPAGDNDPSYPSTDILSIAIAELYSGTNAGKIMLTMRVSTLGDSPSGSWNLSWQSAGGTARVTMVACSGEGNFSYSYDNETTADHQTGTPDAGSYAAGGVIEFIVSRDKIGNPTTGDVFADIEAFAVAVNPEPTCLVPIGSSADNTIRGTYTLGSCVVGVTPQAGRGGLALGPAFPNPTRATAHITLEIPEALAGERLEALIFDLAGRRVRSIASGRVTPGRTTVSWDLRDAAGALVGTGTYWMRLEVAGERQVRTILVRR